LIGVDSNILVYGMARSDDGRHRRVLEVLDALVQREELFLPLQVIGETFHVLVRKGRLDPADAGRLVGTYASFASVEPYGHDDVVVAMDAVARHRLSFWDALIWAVCERMQVPFLVTEDLQQGRVLGSVTFVNPFRDDAATFLGF
jgi:predicted nucleic acid-binding protein